MSRKGCRLLACLSRLGGSGAPRPARGARMGLSLELLSSPAQWPHAERRRMQNLGWGIWGFRVGGLGFGVWGAAVLGG